MALDHNINDTTPVPTPGAKHTPEPRPTGLKPERADSDGVRGSAVRRPRPRLKHDHRGSTNAQCTPTNRRSVATHPIKFSEGSNHRLAAPEHVGSSDTCSDAPDHTSGRARHNPPVTFQPIPGGQPAGTVHPSAQNGPDAPPARPIIDSHLRRSKSTGIVRMPAVFSA